MLPAHSLVKVTFISTRPGILRSRRILNHAKPSITAGGMKMLFRKCSSEVDDIVRANFIVCEKMAKHSK
jgi:hypothetical protein